MYLVTVKVATNRQLKQITYNFFVLCVGDCGCTIDGTEICNSNRECQCKRNVEGARCDKCRSGSYEYPKCEGISHELDNLRKIDLTGFLTFSQNVIVICLDLSLKTVMKMDNVNAWKMFQEQNVMYAERLAFMVFQIVNKVFFRMQ